MLSSKWKVAIFTYIRGLKKTQKNIALSILFLMSIMLGASIYTQSNTVSRSIELSVEDNSISNCLSSDFEINEEDHILNTLGVFSCDGVYNHSICFHMPTRITHPYFAVWEPPKQS